MSEKMGAASPAQVPERANKPSFKAAFIFLIAAVAIKIIGIIMANSAIDAANRSGSFFSTGSHLQDAANIQGTTDVLMLITGLIGVILFVRTIMRRKQASTGTKS